MLQMNMSPKNGSFCEDVSAEMSMHRLNDAVDDGYGMKVH